MEVKNRVKGMRYVDFSEIAGYEFNDLKSEKRDVSKLKAEIKEFGFVSPFFNWAGHNYIIDGTGRKKAIEELIAEGVTIPKLPVVDIEAENLEEAKRIVLAINSQYGKITLKTITNFVKGLDISKLQNIEIKDFPLNRIEFEMKGQEQPKKALADVFIAPPYSILDTRQGYFADRKRKWVEMIVENGESRENTLASADSMLSWQNSVSIFNPVVTEIMNRWFNVPDGEVFDNFAGDVYKGAVFGFMGNKFTGIELRKEQVEINNIRIKNLGLEDKVKYINDDGQNVKKHFESNSKDFLFSCPPYFDLEVYSNLENDASNQKDYESFINILRKGYSDAIDILKENRFAVVVVGDIRNKKTGAYYNFVDDVKKIFINKGMVLYNEIILIDPINTARLRAAQNMKTRKVVKVHQNILVFYKGDTKKIKEIFPDLSSDFEKLKD